MALTLNQQEITAKAGEGVYAPYPARTFRLSKNLAAPCGPTTPCKLVNENSHGLPVVTPITATTDAVYCVIAYDIRNNSFDKNAKVKGWTAGEVIWLKTSDAVAVGTPVMAAADGTVAAQTKGNAVLGIAESQAGAAGELIAVRLTSPYKIYGEVTA